MRFFSYLAVALWIVLAVAQGAMAAAVGRQALRQSHPELIIPTGDPLADRLVFSSAEGRLFLDLEDGHLDEFSLLDAALVACGTADSFTRDRCRNVFAAVLTEVQTQAASDSTTLERAESIHRTLHERLLRGGYDANATDLPETLRTGVYNCASATVLWIALAKELNIDAKAIELPGHVRVVVQCAGEFDEIEVTCPRWPEAVRCWEPSLPALSQGEKENERQISSSGLLAMIYYNRGIDAFNARRYADAVTLNRKALLLDAENKSARGNLLASINNWALALADAGQFDAAETLLAAGRKFEPNHAAFAHNAAHIQQQRLQTQLLPAARAGE